jgi:hypothetical protein
VAAVEMDAVCQGTPGCEVTQHDVLGAAKSTLPPKTL